MVNQKERVILGIDPGTSVLGYGIIEVKGKEISLLAMGVVHLEKIEDHALKLSKIFERCIELIDDSIAQNRSSRINSQYYPFLLTNHLCG